MVGAIIVTVIVTVSLLIFGAYYYIDPLGKRTSTRPRAETTTNGQFFIPQQAPITPVESQFSQFLFGPTVIPSATPPIQATATPPKGAVQPTLSAYLSTDRRSVALQFGSLSEAEKITYFVTYIAKTGAKGVTGSIQIQPPSSDISRSVILGSCSKNVCVYDEVTTPINVRAIYQMIDGRSVELSQTVPY